MSRLPSAESFSMADRAAMRLFFLNVTNRLQQVEQTVGRVGFNTDTTSPVNPAPPLAQLHVEAVPGQNVAVAITNPQFINSGTPGKIRGNISRTPTVHALEYSFDPKFKQELRRLPPGVQTHYVIPTGGRRVYVRLRSSYDGVNYNTAQSASGHSK